MFGRFLWALFLGAFWRSSVYLSPALISFLSARPVSRGEWTGASLLSLFAVSCLGNFCLILGSPPLFYRPFCLFAKLDSLLVSSVKGGERETFPPLCCSAFLLNALLLLFFLVFFIACTVCRFCFLSCFCCCLYPFSTHGVWSTPGGFPCEDSSVESVFLENLRKRLLCFIPLPFF